MKLETERLLDLAVKAARSRLEHNYPFRLGAAGLRKDGVVVVSFNGVPKFPNWKHHAESRLCKKLTPESIVAVARVLWNGELANSRPCKGCQKCLRRKGVSVVYYTIGPGEYGVLKL